MNDRITDIFLMIIFGISGILILALAWSWDMTAADRVLAVMFGSAGLAVALLRGRRLVRSGAGAGAVTVSVKAEDKF